MTKKLALIAVFALSFSFAGCENGITTNLAPNSYAYHTLKGNTAKAAAVLAEYTRQVKAMTDTSNLTSEVEVFTYVKGTGSFQGQVDTSKELVAAVVEASYAHLPYAQANFMFDRKGALEYVFSLVSLPKDEKDGTTKEMYHRELVVSGKAGESQTWHYSRSHIALNFDELACVVLFYKDK